MTMGISSRASASAPYDTTLSLSESVYRSISPWDLRRCRPSLSGALIAGEQSLLRRGTCLGALLSSTAACSFLSWTTWMADGVLQGTGVVRQEIADR